MEGGLERGWSGRIEPGKRENDSVCSQQLICGLGSPSIRLQPALWSTSKTEQYTNQTLLLSKQSTNSIVVNSRGTITHTVGHDIEAELFTHDE